MAETWRAVALGVAFAASKSMLDVFQATGGTRVYRARRMYHFNNGLTSVTGVLTTMRVTRITDATGGSAVTPVAHDTTNAALPAQLTAGTGRTVTTTDVFRQYIWSNDEPAVSAATIDEWELLVPFAEVWNAGYGDTNVQPLVCRATQGVQLSHVGTTLVGANDFEIEFTNEAT
jgi:hypothetical protein